MKLFFSETIEDLRSHVRNNLALYRGGSFEYLLNDGKFTFEFTLEVELSRLTELCLTNKDSDFEYENCKLVFDTFNSLTPYEARDERLWSLCSHTYFLSYARSRWPIPEDDDEAENHVLKHFFAKDRRSIERDNVASRLWWMAHLCARVSRGDFDDLLKAFVFRSDVRANIIERPTASQSETIFGAILRALSKSHQQDQALFQRATFRQLMIDINAAGGVELLDYLDDNESDTLIEGLIVARKSPQE